MSHFQGKCAIFDRGKCAQGSSPLLSLIVQKVGLSRRPDKRKKRTFLCLVLDSIDNRPSTTGLVCRAVFCLIPYNILSRLGQVLGEQGSANSFRLSSCFVGNPEPSFFLQQDREIYYIRISCSLPPLSDDICYSSGFCVKQKITFS